MIDSKLLNKSAVLLMRCSTDPQIATSLKNQNISVEKTISENKITIVKPIELQGVSGSFPGARTDIDQIIALKKSGVPFDLLILPSIDRFTRAGQGHGVKMFWDLESAGIVTYFVAENLFSDDRMHRYIISFMLDAAQQTVISNTRASLLGNTNSFLDARSPHCRVPIYGLDRMYSVEDKDIHRIRPMADGTQLMLSPSGEEVLRRFGKNVKGKMPEHYIKQKNEHVRLVAGDPQHVAVVHLIFRSVYIERRSFNSIAKELNDASIPSPRGTQWEGGAVQRISNIRDTVLNAPSRFLPYNNGLSATASSVLLEDVSDGIARIRSVEDFQIVNGGQTTATITACGRRDGADLTEVSVAMKPTIVPKERVDELVPMISKYANTQNRIQEADFDANRPWHIEMERLSRSTWTQPTQDAPRGTRWFYERSRGQYADELAAQGTAAGRKKFRTENPPGQKFTKTDLAKFRLSWEQRPAIVSRGAQKCFAHFMGELTRENRKEPDLTEFKRTVALGILFHTAEKLYSELDFTGYRAQVVTYSVARLAQLVQCRLPYDEIWESQQLAAPLTNALKILLVGVRKEIVDHRPGNANISEWCKKDQCWSAVLQREFNVDLSDTAQWTGDQRQQVESTSDERVLIEAVKSIPAEVWFSVAKWAKETKTLFPAQRAISFSIGQILARGGSPTSKQAQSARKLLNRARQLGFAHASLSSDQIEKINDGAEDRDVQ